MAESVLEVVGRLQARLAGSAEPKKVMGAASARRGLSGGDGGRECAGQGLPPPELLPRAAPCPAGAALRELRRAGCPGLVPSSRALGVPLRRAGVVCGVPPWQWWAGVPF